MTQVPFRRRTGEGSGQSLQVVTFIVRGISFAVDATRLNSIVMPQELLPPANAAKHLLGQISVRGNAVSVTDVGSRFGLASANGTTGAERILILANARGSLAGWKVDAVADMVQMPVLACFNPLASVLRPQDQECVHAVGFAEDGRILLCLDIDRVVSVKATTLKLARKRPIQKAA